MGARIVVRAPDRAQEWSKACATYTQQEREGDDHARCFQKRQASPVQERPNERRPSEPACASARILSMSDLARARAILGLPKCASHAEIKQRFIEMAKELHPDVSRSADAPQRFQDLHAAYELH